LTACNALLALETVICEPHSTSQAAGYTFAEKMIERYLDDV